MNHHCRFLAFVLLSILVAALPGLAGAAAQRPSGPVLLSGLLAESDAAFLGRVEKITYALAEPSGPESVRVPHTFVTYRVERSFVGSVPGGTVTLRFMGGLDAAKGLYMASSRKPEFDLGDRDILFVQGNAARMCPLVGNLEGRLRVVAGRVYSEEGRSVRIGGGGVLSLGAGYRLPEVESTTVDGRVLQTQRRGPKALDPPGDAVAEADLVGLLAEVARGVAVRAAFVSADPTVPFAGPEMTPAMPPSD